MPEVIFNGPAGRIEGRYHHSEVKNAPVALVLHPHPVHGGTMNNKVAYSLYRSFVRNGFSVLRFNFRGVGKSQGEFDDGIGELADATTAMDWLQSQNPNANIFWVSGFSFGAWIAMQLMMRRPETIGFIAVAPPAGKYDFSFLSPCTASGLIVQGETDSIAVEPDTASLAHKLSLQKDVDIDYRVIKGADHFFRDKLEKLSSYLDEYIQKRLEVDREIVGKRRIGKRRRKSRKSKVAAS
jgi:alpha/beta superfamily hydrolase